MDLHLYCKQMTKTIQEVVLPSSIKYPQHIPSFNLSAPIIGRRILSHAFSERAVSAQEPLVQNYVDQLIKRLEEVTTTKDDVVDMVSWYNWYDNFASNRNIYDLWKLTYLRTTFDIIADLMFGTFISHCR